MIDLLRRFCLDRNNISGTTWLTYLFSYPFICFSIQRNNNAFCCHEINRRFPDLLCFPLISCEKKKRAEIWAPLYKFFLKWCSAEFATLLPIFFFPTLKSSGNKSLAHAPRNVKVTYFTCMQTLSLNNGSWQFYKQRNMKKQLHIAIIGLNSC